MNERKEYLEAGKVRNTHGVKGALKVEHWCDSAEIFTSLRAVYTKAAGLYKMHRIVTASLTGDGTVILRLEGIETFEDAARLKNSVLYAAREELPDEEDRVYIADILGLPVKDADDGTLYGELIDVSTPGTQELFEIKTPSGAIRYVPAVPMFIKRIELGDAVYIKPIPGLLDD